MVSKTSLRNIEVYDILKKTKTGKQMEKKVGGEKSRRLCPWCGSKYIVAPDGSIYNFCPDCGRKTNEEKINIITFPTNKKDKNE